jgi:drug/metabolite transporter (DMT)-like permease
MATKIKLSVISWLILVVLMLTWGSSFILIKRGLTVFDSMQVGALRIGIAFIVLLPFAFSRLKRLHKRHWVVLFFVSFGSAAPAFLFPMAQMGIDSGIAGILNSLTPLFTLIIGLSLFQLKTKWFNVVGVVIGLVGAIGLINVSGGGNFSFNFGYATYIIIATILYAFNGNLIKRFLNDLDSFTITIFSFFIFGLPALIYLFVGTDFAFKFSTHPQFWEGMAYLSILAIVGTAAALIAFFYLIKITNVIFASSVTYLIPIVALAWGIIDGERFEITYVLWVSFILIGIYLVNAKKLLLINRK